MKAAWLCPGCNRYHAPHVDTCPGPVSAGVLGLPSCPCGLGPHQTCTANPCRRPGVVAYPLTGGIGVGVATMGGLGRPS